MSDKLLPCPFCNGEPMIKSWDDLYPLYIVQISCQNCNTKQWVEGSRPTYDKNWCLKKAYEQWNTRHEFAKTGVEEIVSAVRDEIIKEYGSMSIPIDEPNISGYFITGIVKSALTKLLEK